MAGELEDVVLAREVQFLCSDSGQEGIIKDIKDNKIDRVVVAACSPGCTKKPSGMSWKKPTSTLTSWKW
jgi:heterodisulfide reductase subunit A